MLTKVISFLLLVHCMHCTLPTSKDFQSNPCAPDDVKCVSDGFAAFMKETASGIPSLNAKPTDPVTLDSVTSNVIDGVSMHLTNVVVTGFKDEVLTEFKMDTTTKAIAFTAITDFNIATDVEVEYEETKKTFTGTYAASGNTILRITYNYKLKADDKGVDYIDSGPETVTCEFNTLEGDVNKELLDTIEKDPHAKKIQDDNAENIETLKTTHACNILRAAYAVVMEDNRLVEGAIPAYEFFTEL